MLGKAKGQFLRIAACLQMFFCDRSENHEDRQDDDNDGEDIISAATPLTIITETTLKAAVNFVDVCCQHTAYVTGRQTMKSKNTSRVGKLYYINTTCISNNFLEACSINHRWILFIDL